MMTYERFYRFCDKHMPKVDSKYTYLAVINLVSTPKKDKTYYPEVFLKEHKYIKTKVISHNDDNFSGFSSFVYSEDSDEELLLLY